MGFLDPIRRQLRSVISWDDPGEDELFVRWSADGDEIKNASRLIAQPGQGCIFVHEGRVRGLLEREGMIELETGNIPFWTTLTRPMQGFASEHKTAIWFYRRTRILNQKWGTAGPVKYVDPEFGFPVALKAYGNYGCQIREPEAFLREVVGARDRYGISDLREVMIARLVPALGAYLAEKKLAYMEVDARRREIAAGALSRLAPEFARLGFAIEDFGIEGTDFDEGTRQRIGEIADKLADAHAASRLGISYAELQRLMAMRDAARNEGGAAGMLVGAGAGRTLAGPVAAAADASEGALERLRKLKKLSDEALISDAEYAAKKREILEDL
jgi:membrane protease subunit (stomatin/prohibitin family)